MTTRNSFQIHRRFSSAGKADRKGLILDKPTYSKWETNITVVNRDTQETTYSLGFIWMCLGHLRVKFLFPPYACPVVSVSSSLLAWTNTCLTTKLQTQWWNMNLIKPTEIYPNVRCMASLSTLLHWTIINLSNTLKKHYGKTMVYFTRAKFKQEMPQFEWNTFYIYRWSTSSGGESGKLGVATKPTKVKVVFDVLFHHFWCETSIKRHGGSWVSSTSPKNLKRVCYV